MKSLKVYDWEEFLSYCDLGHWESSNEELHVEEITTGEFLDQPDISYRYFDTGMEPMIHVLNAGSYEECYIIDVGLDFFYVIYNRGVCTGTVYFTKKEAEKVMKELEG